MTDVAPGLRARKRAATRRALRVALLELALARGFDNVTVDEVAEAADVSSRTFFNYFASKEEAVAALGGPRSLDAMERAEFLAGDVDPVSDLVGLLARRAPDEEDLEVHRLLRRLMEQEPNLMGEKVASARRLHEEVADVVTERLRLDAERNGSAIGEREAQNRAGLIVMLTLAIARHGWMRWASRDGAETLADSLLGGLDDFATIAEAMLPRR